MLSTSGDTRIEAKVFVRISINTPAVGRVSAWRKARAAPTGRALYPFRFVANPLETPRTVFTAGSAEKGKRGFINRANGRSINIKVAMFI
jgi:hypothetical protein